MGPNIPGRRAGAVRHARGRAAAGAAGLGIEVPRGVRRGRRQDRTRRPGRRPAPVGAVCGRAICTDSRMPASSRPSALKPDLSFSLDLNKSNEKLVAGAGAHRVLAEVDDHRTGGGARRALVAVRAPGGRHHAGGHVRVVRHRHRPTSSCWCISTGRRVSAATSSTKAAACDSTSSRKRPDTCGSASRRAAGIPTRPRPGPGRGFPGGHATVR